MNGLRTYSDVFQEYLAELILNARELTRVFSLADAYRELDLPARAHEFKDWLLEGRPACELCAKPLINPAHMEVLETDYVLCRECRQGK